MANVSNTSVTPATWNGVYPLKDLKAGDTWTGSFTCCKDGSGSSCVGFASMVLESTLGCGSALSIACDFSDANSVKNAFKNIPNSSKVRFKAKASSTGIHAIIVASKSDYGITMYDCNRADDHKIMCNSMTWANILAKYQGIVNGRAPDKQWSL